APLVTGVQTCALPICRASRRWIPRRRRRPPPRRPWNRCVNGYRIRRARPGDAAALVKLGRAVSSEPEAWLITEGDWRDVGDERRGRKSVGEGKSGRGG